MSEAVDELERRENNPTLIRKTNLIDLDRQISGGLADGQLMIIGDRPGSGKSVLGVQIAATFALRDEPALIASLEMMRGEIAGRLAESVNREELRHLPISIVDRTFGLNRIAAHIRLAAHRDGIRLCVVDYLQLIEPDDRSANHERQVAETSRTLKRLAMETQVPIIACCQLNRASEREDRKPRLADLRESGSIEQDADIVGLLHRTTENSELIVAKNRSGAPGVVQLTFRPECFRFENSPIYSGF